MTNLLAYYIVDRKSGISYDPFMSMGKFLVAYSNRATDRKEIIVNVPKIVKGLAERRYRLVQKSGTFC